MAAISHARVRAVALQPLVEGPFVPAPLARALLRRHRIEHGLIHDPYAWIPLARFTALLEDAARETGDDILGARIGAIFRPEHAGPFGALFMTSTTLGAITGRLRQLWRLIQSDTLVEFEAVPRGVACRYRILDPAIAARRQDAELTIAAMASFNRLFLGEEWRPRAVQFEHPEPAGAGALETLLRAPVAFGADANRLIFAKADLARTNRAALQPLDAIVRRHLEDLLRAAPPEPAAQGAFPDFLGAARAHIAAVLAAGASPTVGAAAARLGLTPRTFQRRLAALGLTFRDLVAERRREIAGRMLENRAAPIKAIAADLGYSELSAFSRAYKSWTGTPPRAARGAQ